MSSRLSSKSGLSPSITKGSTSIDLGKNSGVDMGRKTQPSITSGGVGVTQEVTNIGGMSVTGGISVEISPVNFGISTDPSEGSISVAGGAELPGGILGISGGVTIDTNTGEIIGGSVGGEVGGFGINVSNSKEGGLGIEVTVQIPGTPIELSLGFGFSSKKEEPKPTSTIPKGSSNPNPNNLPTSQKCKDGMFELIAGWGSRNDSKPLRIEEWLLKNDAFAIANYSQAREEALADQYLGKGQWYFFPRTFIIFAQVGNWVYIDDSNINFFSKYWFTSINQGAARVKQTAIYNMYMLKGYTLDNPSPLWFSGYTYSHESEIVSIVPPPPCPAQWQPPPPFPNPAPRKKNKMDICCQENLKLLRAIYIRLGLTKFPGKLPATIIQEVSKEGEQPAEPSQVPIENLVDLLDWQFRRDDERWGQWVVQIDVKDADITKEGDQGKQIKFPNLAESIAELEGQMLSVTANIDALVALQVKNLAESGMARQEAIKGYLASKAIIKYMAFKSSEIDVPIPMTFTAGAETISELLKESEGHIKGTDYSEKETWRDICLDLLQAAAIIRAVHWQKIDTKSDTKSQLLSILKGSVDLASTIVNPKKSTNGEENKFDPAQNFEDFLDSVENGFRNTTGISDIENPYGRTPDRRPRIREIGDNLSEAGGDN